MPIFRKAILLPNQGDPHELNKNGNKILSISELQVQIERVQNIPEGIALIEECAVQEWLVEQRNPAEYQSYADLQTQTWLKLIEQFNWVPSLATIVNGLEVPFSYPLMFTSKDLVQEKHRFGIWRRSPAHRNLPEGRVDDTNAIDLLCPHGLPVVSIAKGIILAKQLGYGIYSNEERDSNNDNRYYVHSKLAGKTIIWCVRHLAQETDQKVFNRSPEVTEGELLGKTGFSGYYAGNPPECHLHLAIYELVVIKPKSKLLRKEAPVTYLKSLPIILK